MKYRKALLKILTSELKSTDGIRKELQKANSKTINWMSVIRWLEELKKENKVEMKKLSNIFFWKKK